MNSISYTDYYIEYIRGKLLTSNYEYKNIYIKKCQLKLTGRQKSQNLT